MSESVVPLPDGPDGRGSPAVTPVRARTADHFRQRRRIGPQCGPYGLGHPAEHAGPVAGFRLAEQAHRRIPRAVVAIQHPAPARRRFEGDPHWHAQRAGEVGDGRVAGNDQIERFHRRRHIEQRHAVRLQPRQRDHRRIERRRLDEGELAPLGSASGSHAGSDKNLFLRALSAPVRRHFEADSANHAAPSWETLFSFGPIDEPDWSAYQRHMNCERIEYTLSSPACQSTYSGSRGRPPPIDPGQRIPPGLDVASAGDRDTCRGAGYACTPSPASLLKGDRLQ